MSRHTTLAFLVAAAALAFASGETAAQCTEQGPLNNHVGGGATVCPCFIPGEQAGAVFTVPANEYPIEILKVGIAWSSQFGGAPQSLEQAIHIYEGALPNPGVPTFTLPGPVFTDGVINEFNISLIPGDRIVESGPFTITVEFLNQNAGDPFAPSVVHDATGGQLGKNVVFAIPGGWNDAVTLGVTGNWVFHVKYRSLKATATVGPSAIAFTDVPAYVTTCDTVAIRNSGCATLSIAGISGCDSAPFSIDTTMTAHEVPPGDSTHVVVCVTPTGPGPLGCAITVISNAINGTQVVDVSLGAVSAVGTPGVLNAFDAVSVVPNPFNPSTTIRFSLPEQMAVSAGIFAIDGRRIRTLVQNQIATAGENTLRWDGRDNRGAAVASGVYLVRISTRRGEMVARAVLLK